jgi:hypothetical protein
LLNIFSIFLFNNTLRKLTFNCKGIVSKITLWGELEHFINENVIGKGTTIVVTSTMAVHNLKVNFVIFSYNQS